VAELLTAVGTIVLSSTAIFAFFSYRRQNKREKLRWLQQLYEQFYNQNRYKPVRQRIDFDDLDDLLPLLYQTQTMSQSPTPEDRNKIDEFTDYLNFFEWIAFLESKNALSYKDIDVMFNYYLKRILQIDNKHGGRPLDYIIDSGYEKFVGLLRKHYAPKTSNLFVYGTLKMGGELHGELSMRNARFLGNARIKGKLFRIAGESYPAAVAAVSEDYVAGEVYQLPDPLIALWKIDRVEECDKGLFRRELVDAWLDGKKIKAWSYFYLRPLDKSAQIEGGFFSTDPKVKATRAAAPPCD
jgi:gamma-glutamylcyclotransferase (GGCT)/AIG2-like uncharacterized protein YtfP